MKKSALKILTALTLALVFVFTACGPTSAAVQTDRAGNAIKVPAKVDKIVSLAPSITETLIALGLTDKIVAVDKNSATEIKGIPAGIPQFDMMAPDAEKMIALQPDLVLASGLTTTGGSNPLKPVADTGVCVADIPTATSIQGIQDDLTFMGNITNTSDKAKTMIKTMNDQISAVQAIGKTIQDKKNVYFEIAAAPDIYSFGSNVFLNELLTIIGANNILADQNSWVSVSAETVIKDNPDVILTSVNYIPDPVNEIKTRSGWDVINAVKNNQIFTIDSTASSLPDFNVTTALVQMAKAIYPDQYSSIK